MAPLSASAAANAIKFGGNGDDVSMAEAGEFASMVAVATTFSVLVLLASVFLCAGCCGKPKKEKEAADGAGDDGKGKEGEKAGPKGPGAILTASGKERSARGEAESKTSSSISGKTGHASLATVVSFKLKKSGPGGSIRMDSKSQKSQKSQKRPEGSQK